MGPPRGALRVFVQRGTGLPSADMNGLADPYVKLTVRHITRETRVVHECLDPVWDELVQFIGPLEDFRSGELFLRVCDRDLLKHDDAMGDVRVNLRGLTASSTPLEFVERLSTQGGLTFSVTWEEVLPHELRLGKMQVRVERATDLLAADRNGLSDPYCKLTWLGQKGRTKIVHKSLNPVWEETFSFAGVLHELLSCPLRLRLYDHDRLGRDDPLGEARVSLRPHSSGGALDVQLTVPIELPEHGSTQRVSSSVSLHVTWREEQGAVEEAESEAERRDEARDVVLLHGRLSKRGLMGKWHPRWAEQLA
jgi:synaptotagmin-1